MTKRPPTANAITPSRLGRPLLLTLALVVATGCGGKKTDLVVSGKVTVNGTPVPGGKLILHPADGEGGPTPGGINKDGTFQFGGVAPGPKKVTIDPQVSGSGRPPSDARAKEYMTKMGYDPGKAVPIPKKYTDPSTTDLTWDVSEKNLTKDFDLK